MPNIVGVSSHFHDSACCIFCDGRLVAAAQEERFSRRKHDPRIPKRALAYCLAEAGLSITQVDRLAYYEDPAVKLQRQLWAGLPEIPSKAPDSLHRFNAARPLRDIRRILGYEGEVDFVPHHLSHAAGAFFGSGFDDAAILTIDGVGEWATMQLAEGSGTEIRSIHQIHFPHSIGLLYSTITAYLGFEVNDGEYKVMGLAPYGVPGYVEQLWQLIRRHDGANFELEMDFFSFLNQQTMYSPRLIDLLGQPPRLAEAKLDEFATDLSRSIQVVLEELLLEKARWLGARNRSENLCLSGGVALNCVAARRLREDAGFRRLFVQPAASDAGAAVGAAAVAHIKMTGTRPDEDSIGNVFTGPAYSADHVATILGDGPARYDDFRNDEPRLLQSVAARLKRGEVIGWFQGRMEFGPRALGARSILADPRREEMRDRINALVKKREAFRPFAPAVLEDKAHEHFELAQPSPFMLETCAVRSPLTLPAITHVDGSARVQTVNEQRNGRFARLITEFDRQTGCPILLNTSFNLRGEPIVCTPIEALLCFIRSDIDALVIEDCVLDRKGLPEFWQKLHRHSLPPGPARISNAVYTFL